MTVNRLNQQQKIERTLHCQRREDFAVTWRPGIVNRTRRPTIKNSSGLVARSAATSTIDDLPRGFAGSDAEQSINGRLTAERLRCWRDGVA